MKEFEKHFYNKYPKVYRNEDLKSSDLQKVMPYILELIKIDSVKHVYETSKAYFIIISYLLLTDDEITYTMATEMEPYQLAILRLNTNIDRQTRLYAEINWK
jgi:hypothetical protein